MGYLGQKYEKGLVIQRSEEGSAFQEDVEVTVEGEQELTPKVGGGFKKVTVNGAGGSEVIPNPEMEGDEPDLEGIEIDGDKYKIPEGTTVEANPELEGNEEHLSSLEIDGTKYNLHGVTFDHDGITNISGVEYQAVGGYAAAELYAIDNEGENGASVSTGLTRDPNGEVIQTYVEWNSNMDDVEATIEASCEINDETGDLESRINLNADEININGQPYSPGTEVIANPTLVGSEPNLTGLQVGNNKYKVPQGGGASVSGINIDVFHASNDDAVTMTRLTNTPQALNFIMDSSDLYDYFNSLYNHIKEDCQQGYVYDSSSGSIAEADLSKGMYQGISGQYNGETIYGLVACQSENEYGESRRELGAVNSGLIIDSSFAIVEDGQVEQTISLIEQKSIGME